MSLLFKHPRTGGELHQAGAKEIPSLITRNNIELIVFSAEEYQPESLDRSRRLQAMKISPLQLTNFREFVKAEKVYVPMKDSSDLMGKELRETIARAKFAANEVIETIMGGGNALVTCKAGWNRSGLISGLALKKLTDASPRRIISSIRKNRSIFALSNPLFVEIIKRG